MSKKPLTAILLGVGVVVALELVAPAGEAQPVAVDPPVESLPNTAGSFSTAKKWLYEKVYYDHRVTFYCGCEYSEDREIDLTNCGYIPRMNESRAAQVEAEHVFPASHFGNYRECWREPLCTNTQGEAFKGRECCLKIDPVFEAAHNDLFNLYPSVGEVNGDRSDYRWGVLPGEDREYGSCDIEIDSETRQAEPPELVRGDIARTYFYMEATYGFRLSDGQRQLFEAWDNQDPVDDWERERNRRITAIQGQGNSFIQ